MNRVALLLLLGAGCGRWRFDELFDGDAASNADDTGADVQSSSCGHTFCDDFDRNGPPEAGWDTITNSGLAVPSLTTAGFTSPPQAFQLHLPGTSLENGFLVKQLPEFTNEVRLEVQLSIETTNVNDAEIDLIRIKWDALPAPCTSFGYYLVRDSTMQFNLQETYGGCGGNEQNYQPLLDNTGFHKLTMIVKPGIVGFARVQLLIDNAMVVDHTTSHAIPESTLTLQIGAGAARNIVAPWDFFYDDLIVDVN